MIRTKGEPGTGDVVQAVRHMRMMQCGNPAYPCNLAEDELYRCGQATCSPRTSWCSTYMKTGSCPSSISPPAAWRRPADAALMMQLGAEGVFVGSGIFKSGNPEKRAAAIVKAVTNFNDAHLLAELSEDLGEAMVGINEQEIELLMAERGK